HRLKYSIRGQTERRPVRSHKIAFLQWVTGCLIRGGLPAMRFSVNSISDWTDAIAGKPPPTVLCSASLYRFRSAFQSLCQR
ncbi:hypothetical protein, partial [Pseudomonas viridiflava]|uniref:hypothetical protein n=1 Tax=Pseudomonas viridiflava TaxID=33069 RepID=UPI001E3BFD16